jgi:hypothetical protein
VEEEKEELFEGVEDWDEELVGDEGEEVEFVSGE